MDEQKDKYTLIYDEILWDDPDKGAVLFRFEDDKVWIPRSLFEIIDDRCNWVQIEGWKVLQEGLEQYSID